MMATSGIKGHPPKILFSQFCSFIFIFLFLFLFFPPPYFSPLTSPRMLGLHLVNTITRWELECSLAPRPQLALPLAS